MRKMQTGADQVWSTCVWSGREAKKGGKRYCCRGGEGKELPSRFFALTLSHKGDTGGKRGFRRYSKLLMETLSNN